MNTKTTILRRQSIFFGLFLVSLATIACSKQKPKVVERTDAKPATSNANHFDGGTYCIQTISQGPPVSQPVHFSNKQNESDGSLKDFETDLSSDKLDVTFHQRRPATQFDTPSTHGAMDQGDMHIPAQTLTVADGVADIVETSHYTRSHAHEWAMGTTVVAQGGTPWGLFISKPNVTKVGSETINGFETDKYTIDTTQQGQMDKVALLMAGGLKDYNITGTAWMAKQPGCIVQYQIDYEEDNKDGSVRKVHYEGTTRQ